MDELVRWSDNAPTLRHFQISYFGGHEKAYSVHVWTEDGRSGRGDGHSLNFASVKALIAYDASEAAP